MAKNILSQKKRVTHIKNMPDNQYNDESEMQSESFDYVYNIMKGMDSTKAVGYNPSDDSLKMELLSLTNDEYTEIQKSPAASTSNDSSQAVKAAVIKLKKFTNTRKFPLMEKSQKILKQLKHNRSIPKPRAHLASINMSPRKDFSNTNKSLPNSKKELKQRRVINEREKSVKTNTLNKSNPVLTATVISEKSKEVCIVKNKTNITQINTKVKTNISEKISKPVVTAINVHKSKELHIVKNVINDINLKKLPKRNKSDNNCMDARQRNLKMGCNINDAFSNKNMQSKELSDGNTTDSEYERFIQNNKVEFEEEIPKKRTHQSKKKKVNQKKKTHSKSKLQKCFPLESPDHLDSNCFDDLSDFDDKKKLERSFSKESLVEHYDSNCYSASSDEGGRFEKEIPKKSKKMQLKEKKMQKKKLQCKKNLQKCFPLESPDERGSNCPDNLSDHDDEKNLERSFSKESLVEHYDSNCYSDSSDESEEFEREISKKSKEKQPKEKMVQKKKSNHINESLEGFSLGGSTDTHDSNCLDNLSDCGKKESERIESRVSMENLVEHFDSNCFNNTSSGEGAEINIKIKSAVMKSSENILLNNPKIVDDNTSSNLKSIRKLHCSSNKDEDKSNDCQFKNFVSVECPNLIEPSNLGSNLDSSVRFEDKDCIDSLKPVINETSMNYTQNCSQGIPNTNLHNSSTSKCLPVCSDLDKCDEFSVENLVIDLFSSDSEQENTESSQITVQKENFREIKETQTTALTNADSEESDIEVIEVVPVSNKNKPATNCSISGASSDDLNRMSGVDSTNYKTNENEIKFSQTCTFDNIPKSTEPMVLDTNVSKNMHPSLEIHLNEKLVKKEPKIAESNNPVYMTGMCNEYDNEIISKINGDPLGNCAAVLKECKLEKCEAMEYVNEDDDIMIIEPSANQSVKQEVLDDDVIIDFVSVKKEQNPESTVERSVSSKRKNQIYNEDLESKLKNECPVSCKEPKISSIIDNTSVGKVLPIIDCSLTKSLIEQNFSSDPLIISKIMPLIDLYKKEFIMYQEIVRTEENVEAGLRIVEAHQAEKLKCIQSLIQNFVKKNACFDKIYSDPVKTKEQDPVQLKSFQNYPVDKLQASSSKNTSEIHSTCSQDSSEDSSNKLTASLPSVHIKTEKEEKPGSIADPICLDISHSVARIKTEPGTPINSQASLACDVPESKQALKLTGKKCDVCGKEAVAACQRCAKAFFCSDECGKKFWIDGHERVCDKYV